MKKRGIIVLVVVFALGVLCGIGSFLYNRYKPAILEKQVIEKYGFEISYPKSYKDNSKSGDDEESQILSNVKTQVSGEVISEYMANLNFVETVKNLKNDSNGIRLIIEAINIEKTELSLEEICSRYVVMFKVYNTEQVVKESQSEIINIAGVEAGKVRIKIKGEIEDSILVGHLISLEDREITIAFIAPESTIDKYENEINKIINSIVLY